MIKLKQLLFESTVPDIFVPRRTEDRLERMIKQYIRNGSKGDLELSNMNLTELPEILKDISVGGHFFCSGNSLTTLENSPKTVGGSFFCGRNQLISLKGAPKTVGDNFFVVLIQLNSLENKLEQCVMLKKEYLYD